MGWLAGVVPVATAVIAAVAAGFGSRMRGHDEPGYRWLQWWAPVEHRRTVRVVTASHALVGVVATTTALVLGWYPLGGSLWFLDALVYAAIGEAVFRSDWSDFFLDAATPASSLLHILLRERQENLRDVVVHRHMPIFLSKLDDGALVTLVTRLIDRRFTDADEIALGSKNQLVIGLNAAGAALEGKLADEQDGVVRVIRGDSAEQRRREALVWLTGTAVREIQAVEYRVPGFSDVISALASIGKDLVPDRGLVRGENVWP